MESSKLKNLVLLILILTNLGLLAFTVQRRYQETRLQGRALEDAVRFLASRGVAVDGADVPDAGALPPQTAARDLEREAALAAGLLGEDVRPQSAGAEVYRYENGRGYLQFHGSGAFSGEFTPGAIPIGGDPEAGCLELLDELGIRGEPISRGEDTLVFRQLWQEVPLFSQQITLEVKEGSLVSLTAQQQLAGTPAADLSRQTVSTATALIQFLNGVSALGDVCSRVERIQPGYVGAVPLSGPMALTPVWSVTTDTGSYQLDLVSGELTRAVQEGAEG